MTGISLIAERMNQAGDSMDLTRCYAVLPKKVGIVFFVLIAVLSVCLPMAATGQASSDGNYKLEIFHQGFNPVKNRGVLRATGDRYRQSVWRGGHDDEELDTSEANPFQLGVLCPMTGNYADFGEQTLRGVLTALEVADVHADFALILGDTRGDPVTAITETRRLIKDENVFGIVGPVLSDCVLGSGALANELGVTLITPTATTEGLNKIGPSIFQVRQPLEHQAIHLADIFIRNTELRRFCVVYSDSERGRRLMDAFARRMIDGGGEPVLIEEYPQLISEQDHVLQRILTTAPELIYIPAYTHEVVQLVTLLDPESSSCVLAGNVGWNSDMVETLDNPMMHAAFTTVEYFRGNDSAINRQFVKHYSDRFGEAPNHIAALGFDAAAMIIERVMDGCRTRASLYEEIGSIKNRESLTGTISYGEDGTLLREPVILGLDNRGYREIVLDEQGFAADSLFTREVVFRRIPLPEHFFYGEFPPPEPEDINGE